MSCFGFVRLHNSIRLCVLMTAAYFKSRWPNTEQSYGNELIWTGKICTLHDTHVGDTMLNYIIRDQGYICNLGRYFETITVSVILERTLSSSKKHQEYPQKSTRFNVCESIIIRNHIWSTYQKSTRFRVWESIIFRSHTRSNHQRLTRLHVLESIIIQNYSSNTTSDEPGFMSERALLFVTIQRLPPEVDQGSLSSGWCHSAGESPHTPIVVSREEIVSMDHVEQELPVGGVSRPLPRRCKWSHCYRGRAGEGSRRCHTKLLSRTHRRRRLWKCLLAAPGKGTCNWGLIEADKNARR